ncbi:hypothetical protein ABT354_36350 [Streptomyces sp. NPDC000594]|uniref:hypothetical protein n=1 Tax=Streptomyces sp. NPDC000594 TaxID=3154261 RepID=UPI0033306D62
MLDPVTLVVVVTVCAQLVCAPTDLLSRRARGRARGHAVATAERTTGRTAGRMAGQMAGQMVGRGARP